tara:strand:- start:1898 stop:2950 length:1053 start_codon:yes stop_codon:yes gene_type:complete
MKRENTIEAFSLLGIFLSQFETPSSQKNSSLLNDPFYASFSSAIYTAKIHNGWFEETQVRRSLYSLSKWLTKDLLSSWAAKYPDVKAPKKVGLIMAGNIPLVGFHDFVCVLVSGNNALIKLSSDDKILLPLLVKMLQFLDKDFSDRIEFTDNRFLNFDAIIATGSNNSARYFEHYFGKYPHIIRKNRNSIGVLDGHETTDDLAALGDDIFSYFGLGCRNISKVYVPRNYKFDLLFESLFEFKDIVNNKKYANNVDYYRALFLMGGNKMLENGFLLIREDELLASPISMLHYEFYDNLDELKLSLKEKEDQIQCIVSNTSIPNSFKFGTSQSPSLNDYADRVDTMAFLTSL